MSEDITFKSETGLNVVGTLEHVDQESKRVVIIVHGFSSNRNGTGCSQIGKELTSRNVNSFRIDLNGCGESDGLFEEHTTSKAVGDIMGAVTCMKDRGFEDIELFGSSAGGLDSMAFASQYPDIKRICLKAPVADFPTQRLRKNGQAFMDAWKKKGYYHYENNRGEKFKVNYTFMEDAEQYVMYDKVGKVECPVLILHGDKDEHVDLEDSQKIIKQFPDGKLIVIPGMDHFGAIDGDTTVHNSLVGDWFEKGDANLGDYLD